MNALVPIPSRKNQDAQEATLIGLIKFLYALPAGSSYPAPNPLRNEDPGEVLDRPAGHEPFATIATGLTKAGVVFKTPTGHLLKEPTLCQLLDAIGINFHEACEAVCSPRCGNSIATCPRSFGQLAIGLQNIVDRRARGRRAA